MNQNFKRLSALSALLTFSAFTAVSAPIVGWVAQVQTSAGSSTYRYTSPEPDYNVFISTVVQPLFNFDSFWAERGLFQNEIYYTVFDCKCTVYVPGSNNGGGDSHGDGDHNPPPSSTPEPSTGLLGLAAGVFLCIPRFFRRFFTRSLDRLTGRHTWPVSINRRMSSLPPLTNPRTGKVI